MICQCLLFASAWWACPWHPACRVALRRGRRLEQLDPGSLPWQAGAPKSGECLEPTIYPKSIKTNAIMSRSASSRAACLLLAMLTTWLGASATPRLQVMRLFAKRGILTQF